MFIFDKATNKNIWIDKDTISFIRLSINGKYLLTFYKDCKVAFEKEYNSFVGAKIAESHYMKKLYN